MANHLRWRLFKRYYTFIRYVGPSGELPKSWRSTAGRSRRHLTPLREGSKAAIPPAGSRAQMPPLFPGRRLPGARLQVVRGCRVPAAESKAGHSAHRLGTRFGRASQREFRRGPNGCQRVARASAGRSAKLSWRNWNSNSRPSGSGRTWLRTTVSTASYDSVKRFVPPPGPQHAASFPSPGMCCWRGSPSGFWHWGAGRSAQR